MVPEVPEQIIRPVLCGPLNVNERHAGDVFDDLIKEAGEIRINKEMLDAVVCRKDFMGFPKDPLKWTGILVWQIAKVWEEKDYYHFVLFRRQQHEMRNRRSS